MYDCFIFKNLFKSCKKILICYYVRNRFINIEVVLDVLELDIVDFDLD